MKINRPIPAKLAPYNPSDPPEMFYRCPKCNIIFKVYGEKEHFCHNCGLQLDWSKTVRFVSDKFKDKYLELTDKVYGSTLPSNEIQAAKDELVKLLVQLYNGEVM